jgi:hypothetical protein
VIRRTDANHKEIVDAIRKIPSLSVFSTHTIGKGFPDIVIGYKGINYLVEIKDGAKTKSQKKLTEDEIRFHQSWFGQIIVCECVQDVYVLLKINT